MPRIGLVAAGAMASLALLASTIAPTTASASTAATVVYEFSMPPGSNYIYDSGTLGLNGTFRDPRNTTATFLVDPEEGDVVYLHPAIFVTQNDSRLSPGDRDVTLTVTYRTTEKVGYTNIAQIGTSRPGQLVGVKVETVCRTASGGYCPSTGGPAAPRCEFTGTLTHVNLTDPSHPVNDGRWHTITCLKRAGYAEQIVDGDTTPLIRQTAVGSINTGSAPFSVGGKYAPNRDVTRDQIRDGYLGRVALTLG